MAVSGPASPSSPVRGTRAWCIPWDDFSFETEVRDLNPACEVHTFDPTTDAAESSQLAAQVNSAFRSVWWGNRTVVSIAEELGHLHRRIDVLKIDCEGCEFLPGFLGFFQNCAPRGGRPAIPVGQLLIEVHATRFPPPAWNETPTFLDFSLISELFSSIEQCSFHLFHKERNHWGCYGYPFSFASWDAARTGHWLDHCPEVPWEEFLDGVGREEGRRGSGGGDPRGGDDDGDGGAT